MKMKKRNKTEKQKKSEDPCLLTVFKSAFNIKMVAFSSYNDTFIGHLVVLKRKSYRVYLLKRKVHLIYT